MPVRWAIGAVVAAIFVSVAVWSYQNHAAEEVPLYAQALAPDQIAEVVKVLNQEQIPIDTTADNVLVPSSRKADILFRLSNQGVPHDHVATTQELGKAINPMMPTQQINQAENEGLRGDIVQMLRRYDGVLDATVLIAKAKTGGFADETATPATASVELKLDKTIPLDPQAISGMRRAVANSVSGLTMDNVTITDQSGHELTNLAANQGPSDVALTSQIDGTLERIFGHDMAWASVNVETQATASTSHEVKHMALADKPISTDAEREHYTGKNKSYDKVRQNTDRGSDTIETNTQTTVGDIRRKTIAIFVNRSAIAAMPADLKATIADEAGIDESRGDRVSITTFKSLAGAAVAPAIVPAPNPTGSGAPQAVLATFGGIPIPIAILVLAAIVAFSYLGWLFIPQGREEERSIAAIATTKIAADLFEPVRVHASLRDEPPHTAAAILATLPSPTATAVLELYTPEQRREIIKRLTKQSSPVVRDESDKVGRA